MRQAFDNLAQSFMGSDLCFRAAQYDVLLERANELPESLRLL